MPSPATISARPVVNRLHTSSPSLTRLVLSSALLIPCAPAISAQANSPVTPGRPSPAGTVFSIALAPQGVTLAPGDRQQFSATFTGTGSYGQGIHWTVNNVAGGNAALGTVSGSGLYITPYPAPQSVTIRATSTFEPAKSAEAIIIFATPPLANGPTLTVDAAAARHAISPLVYGMNSYRQSDPDHESLKVAKAVRLTLDRWGGDGVTRYNYKLDISNHAAHWFYENIPNANSNYPDVSEFNTQVADDRASGAKTMGTVPVMGWVARSRTMAGSFSVAKYGPQQKTDPYWTGFGNGLTPDGKKITGNDPTDTCIPVDASWTEDWVKYLVNKFGDAAHGGVAIYSLDNEPNWWDLNHRDVHPLPFTYDELTENGIKVARAVKAADPTAEVSGPVIDNWYAYFYSQRDLETVRFTSLGITYDFSDRASHGNLPFIEYYLRTFKAAQDADPNHARLLDYLDLHTYFAPDNAQLNPVANSENQKAVINSTRVFWDPTYTDQRLRDPNNYAQTIPPMMIRRMRQWIAANYPGTKTAITEYNWGAQEHISGAVAQADILGIFGREALDLGALWGPPDLDTPAMFAFKIFRNYDDAGGAFGDISIGANSSDQGSLAVYAALRNTDNSVTVIVINKTFEDLKSDLVLIHLKTAKHGRVFQYSNADLKQIRALPDAKVALISKKDGTLALKDQVFPAMSITLYSVPVK
jgi:hypothetical protein